MAEIEKICEEKKASSGTEYLVRWKGFNSSHDEWLKESDIQGLGSLLLYWRERNKRVGEEKQMRANKEEGSIPPTPYTPNREPEIGDVISIYPPKTEEDLIFADKVLSVSPSKYTIHWWSAKKIDGTWGPQFLSKKGKGHAGVYSGQIWKEAVLDVLTDLRGKKTGKIGKKQLNEIIKIAKDYKKQ